MSSLITRAVNDIATMFKNSFSKRTKDIIMIAAPASNVRKPLSNIVEALTLVQTDHKPLEECLVRQRSALVGIRESTETRGESKYKFTFVSSLYSSGYNKARSSLTSRSRTKEKTGAMV
jgi:hypothetical protein